MHATASPAGPARWMSLNEAAEYTGLSPKTIRRRVSDGSVKAFRAGPREIRFRPADLDALMRPIPAAVR